MRLVKGFLIIVLVVALVCCSAEQEVKVYSASYSFVSSDQEWTGGFSDYPIDSTGYHLQFELDTLPYKVNTDSTKKGLRISGINGGDELFMFIKRKFSGLQKNTTYQLLFNVRLASNAPLGEVDGGVPGENVFVKVGGLTEEPETEIVSGYYRMNLDKGDLSENGGDMVTIGNVGVATTTVDYALITRSNSQSNSVLVTTNAEGELWLIVGTDSGFEGKTTLYYTQVDVYFNEVD